ncbi:MAG: glycosyltransferase family 4 protein [Methanobacterium sp.]
MKVCIVSNLYPPLAFGGATGVAASSAEHLAERGHEVIVITISPDKKNYIEEINKVKVYRINPLNFFSFYDDFKDRNRPAVLKFLWHAVDLWNVDSYFEIKKILKNEAPDIVHVHNYKGISMSLFNAVKKLNIPLVFTAHDHSFMCIRAGLLKGSGEMCHNPNLGCKFYVQIQKMLAAKPDLITAPSNFLIENFKKSGLFKDVEMIKIANPIVLGNEIHEKTYGNIDILYVGELYRHKGVETLIKAFKKLNNSNINLHLLGKIKDNSLIELIESDERIIFHGFLINEELNNMYQKANITVVPSICFDNSPMVIYESFVNGTPVIGSKIGGIPELIQDGYNGFLFEPGNVNELMDLLKDLIDNPKKLKDLEKGALESVKEYGTERYIEKLETIFKQILKN